MAKKKFYAVKRGKVTGVFYTWDECKSSIDGYSGAEYKGFSTEEEARQYLLNDAGKMNTDAENREECVPGKVIAYVDGSFDEKIGRYAFGCVIILPSGEVIKESGNGDAPDSLLLRNVAGEMLGAMFAVRWCGMYEYPAIDIRYDYSGIEKWVTGEWRTKNELTGKYADYMRRNGRKMQITFTKIRAHTGNHYNEEADKLAKEALKGKKGIPEVKKGD